LVWLSVKQAAGQPLVGKPVKITSAKILWLPVGSRPNTQDRAGNQVAYIPIMSAKVSSRISKERAHRKKPDIQRQQGNRKTLKVTAAEEYTIFHANLSLVAKYNLTILARWSAQIKQES